MPTFTFTNNNGFEVYFYSITQPGTLRGWGSVTEREKTKTFSRPSSRYRITLYNKNDDVYVKLWPHSLS